MNGNRIPHATSHKLLMLFHTHVFSKSTGSIHTQFYTCNKNCLTYCQLHAYSCVHICDSHKQLQVYILIFWFVYMVFSEEPDLYRTGKK